MKILYIDESGVPELSATSAYVIFCGVLINEEEEGHFSFLMQKIKEKYNLNLNTHIHAVEVFEKSYSKSYLGNTVRRRKKDLRAEFQKEIWDLIKRYSIEYYVVTVPKTLVRSILTLGRKSDNGENWINSSDFYAKIDNHLPMDVGINLLYRWALKKARANKLKVIFESRSTSDLFTVRNHNYITDLGVYKDAHMIAFGKDIRNRVVSVAFANKEVKSVGLELADVISYTCNIYFLQIKKGIGRSRMFTSTLQKAICFKGIHRTLNGTHYLEAKQTSVRKYIPGRIVRTKRIAKHYERLKTQKLRFSYSLSPAKSGSPGISSITG